MQADGGLIQHIAHALQIRAQLCGQADALRFAARQGRGGAIQLQVAQADAHQEVQAGADLGQQIAPDLLFARRELQSR